MTAARTRQLASARLEVASDLRSRTLMRSVLVVVLVSLAVIAGVRLLADGRASASERDRLQQHNAELQATVTRLQTELQIETATRDALDQQVADLSHQLAELERQLAFLDAQRTRPRTPTK